jgi:transcription initiation factor TFIIIB Brf1 subunit/transcription initiation factor TFIIB
MPDDNEEQLINCNECSNEMSQDDSFTTNSGDVVCSDCSRVCEYCERLYTSSDEWYNVDDQAWCEVAGKMTLSLVIVATIALILIVMVAQM